MNNVSEKHLTEAELIAAVVDPEDLSEDRRGHLKSCIRCRDEHKALINQLDRLGAAARNMAPRPARPFRLNTANTARKEMSQRRSSLALYGGVLAAVLLVVFWWSGRAPHEPPALPPGVALELEAAAQFMAEINAMVEDATPVSLQQLGSVLDEEPAEDITEFIVPELGEPVHESALAEKGGRPC